MRAGGMMVGTALILPVVRQSTATNLSPWHLICSGTCPAGPPIPLRKGWKSCITHVDARNV
jgi:hypothetical protein